MAPTAEMITRCPKCDTAFRITSAQLKPARGSVRCGSCLHVFNAKDNLTPSSRAALKAAKTRGASRRTASKPTVAVPPADDLLISDDMEPLADDQGAEAGETEERVLREGTLPQTSLFERAPPAAEEDLAPSDDESWAEQLLAEDESQPAPPRDKFTLKAKRSLAKKPPPTETPEPDWQELYDRQEAASENEEASPTSPLSTYSYLNAIEPEPVEFAYRAEKPFWHRRTLWVILSLLALLLLAGQIAWLQYPTLNRTEPWRGFYQLACGIIGCQLPTQLDPSAIHTSNLIVRSHPRVADALMVDVILQNGAPFQQPFPDLELTFSNLSGKIVARRQFKPKEYLGGELAGQTMMPVEQPVHLALEIVDPGRQAINYRIDVVGESP